MSGFHAFFLGGLGYVGLELLWRGRSHWSMFFAGGLCVALLLGLYSRRPMPWPLAMLCGGSIITAVEFLFGYVCNLRLGLGVWDYSHMPCNAYGQICLPYSLLWGALSLGLWALV